MMTMTMMMILVLTAATIMSCLFDAGGTLSTHSAPTFCLLKTWLISAEIAYPDSFEECQLDSSAPALMLHKDLV